jgi:hypothetical protein
MRAKSSPYIIQGYSAAVRGQTKLLGEGEPQGDNRQAPEPPDTPRKARIRKDRERKQGMACNAMRKKDYMSAPLQEIRELED